jgi:ribosomal protein L37AE/L43A
MICRQCPNCGEVRYSANTLDWECSECGAVLTDEHNKPLEPAAKSVAPYKSFVEFQGNVLRQYFTLRKEG